MMMMMTARGASGAGSICGRRAPLAIGSGANLLTLINGDKAVPPGAWALSEVQTWALSLTITPTWGLQASAPLRLSLQGRAESARPCRTRETAPGCQDDWLRNPDPARVLIRRFVTERGDITAPVHTSVPGQHWELGHLILELRCL
ncbi:hypothetical protein AAFF_G00250820 [Aldrovandia affinis]|uniref:Uncharacterized protein n=1 Tax=Aldrovandia affinis TaxID=143900 RepID=A0AAD7RDC1_9TELE|nr:hypothetical protein AAFF_G00250820 [Aldrovandia affinis]